MQLLLLLWMIFDVGAVFGGPVHGRSVLVVSKCDIYV